MGPRVYCSSSHHLSYFSPFHLNTGSSELYIRQKEGRKFQKQTICQKIKVFSSNWEDSDDANERNKTDSYWILASCFLLPNIPRNKTVYYSLLVSDFFYKNSYKCGVSNNTHFSLYSSIGQNSNTSLLGLKPRCQQGCIPFSKL